MAKTKVTIVPIESLKQTFFVRQQLNDEHVLMLAALYEAGQELPPILVTREHEVVDGRHRIAARDLLSLGSVGVVYTDEQDRGELIFHAFRANTGGSLPPTKADTTYAIRQLLEAGVSQTRIIAELPFPPTLVRAFIQNVKAGISRDKVSAAARAVAEGEASVAEAAQEFKVPLEAVRSRLTGNRQRSTQIGELKGNLSNIHRSRSRTIANVYSKLLSLYTDDEVSDKKVTEVLEHAQGLLKQAEKTARDWRVRFEAVKKSKAAAKRVEEVN